MAQGHDEHDEGSSMLYTSPAIPSEPESPVAEPLPARDSDEEAAYEGQHIGKYQILRRIGKGGMGVVYEAVHREIAQRIAVKILAGRLARRESYRRRFLYEAQLSSKVRDPGLVQVFDYGTLPDGRPYILMEYIEGPSLAEVLRAQGERRLPLARVTRLCAQLAAALQVAHDAGIVHRDIKPDNVMLLIDAQSSGERIKVLDFGIAKLISAVSKTPTGSRAPVGTPIYMSPEQCRGVATVDAKSDVYSLGVLLYELLVGRPPFVPDPADAGAVLRRHVFDTPRSPRRLRRDIPPVLDELTLRMLHKSPGQRPTMSEVAVVLQELGSGATTRYGIALALAARMAVLLLLLIPFCLQGYYYFQHRELWLPGNRPVITRIAGDRFIIGSTEDEIENTINQVRNMGGVADSALFRRETPSKRINVSDFYIDNYEVTNQSYATWLNRINNELAVKDEQYVYHGDELWLNVYPKRQAGIIYADARFVVVNERAAWPVVQVTWAGAQRFCESRQMRLPTEAEWELAARGVRGRFFPWGDSAPTCDSAVFDLRTLPAAACPSSFTSPQAVGSRPRDRTPDGVFDLGGNVAEWVFDYYRQHYLRCSDSACDDPVVGSSGEADDEKDRRVVRGGSWYREFDALRAAGRSRLPQNRVTSDIGFRCVRPTRHS